MILEAAPRAFTLEQQLDILTDCAARQRDLVGMLRGARAKAHLVDPVNERALGLEAAADTLRRLIAQDASPKRGEAA